MSNFMRGYIKRKLSAVAAAVLVIALVSLILKITGGMLY